MEKLLRSLPLIALALLTRCEIDDSSNDDQMGGTSSGGAAGSNAAGSGAQSGSAGTGGGAGSGAGGACAAESGDGVCNTCLKSQCCTVWPACEADSFCAACSACLDQENDLGMCLIMTPPICDNAEMPTFDLLGCALEHCVAECGLD